MQPREAILLTRLRDDDAHPRKSVYRCVCGTEKSMFRCNVASGKSASCGCVAKRITAARSTIHGNAKRGQHSGAYVSWYGMIAHTTKPYRHDFERYGARGIKVCERWLSFANFLVDMGERPAGKTLDRFPDNNGDYAPGNCRWATPKEQANNRRPRSPNKPKLIATMRAHNLASFDA